MTESDPNDARDVVEGRVERRRERGRRRSLAAAAAAVVIPALGLVAFQALGGADKAAPPVTTVPTGPSSIPDDDHLAGRAPTREIVEGVWRTDFGIVLWRDPQSNGAWRIDNGIVVLRFSPPNLISFDGNGRVFDRPSSQGTYVIAGDRITVTLDSGPAHCAHQTFAMRASLAKPGEVRVVPSWRGLNGCAPVQDMQGVLKQVLPTNNEGLAGLVPSHDQPGNWELPEDKRALYGDWQAEGGGHMLELAPGGAYYLADESGDVVDRGQWSWQGPQLALTSSAKSTECSKGDRLVLGGLEQLSTLAPTVMRGTVEQNRCGGAWASEVWILIPHVSS